MAKAKFTYFTVTGTGMFPTDMLRYDSAYPVDHTNGQIAVYDTDRPEFYGTPRSVNLKTAHTPTIERWRSFGWTVSNIEGRSW